MAFKPFHVPNRKVRPDEHVLLFTNSIREEGGVEVLKPTAQQQQQPSAGHHKRKEAFNNVYLKDDDDIQSLSSSSSSKKRFQYQQQHRDLLGSGANEDSLILVRKLQLVTSVQRGPSSSAACISSSWSLDRDTSHRFTTSYVLQCRPGTNDCFEALCEIANMIDDETSMRTYVFDQALDAVAVICSRSLAFWAGVTSHTRQELKKRGVEYEIPLADEQPKCEQVDELLKYREAADDLNMNVPRAAQRLGEKPLTLVFDSALRVRGLVDCLINFRRKDARCLIVCSSPFPGCTVQVHKFSRPVPGPHKDSLVRTMEGYLSVRAMRKVVDEFRSQLAHNEHSLHVTYDIVPATASFDIAHESSTRHVEDDGFM